MSLIGTRTAVVPIGLSCQAAIQLRWHERYASLLLGERMQYSSSFFNYLLSDRDGIAPLLRSLHDEAFWAGDFITDRRLPIEIEGGLALWHDWQHGIPASQVKFRHLASKLRALQGHERRIFIVSNTQNNLDEPEVRGHRNFAIDLATMADIRAAVDEAFPGGGNEVHFVLRPHRAPGVPPQLYFAPDPDDSEVNGHVPSWQRILHSILEPTAVRSLLARTYRVAARGAQTVRAASRSVR